MCMIRTVAKNRFGSFLFYRDAKEDDMKGFLTSTGYMGLVEGRYILFASEQDYREYMAD